MRSSEADTSGITDPKELVSGTQIQSDDSVFRIVGHAHFSIIAPLTEMRAKRMVQGRINVTREGLRQLW